MALSGYEKAAIFLSTIGEDAAAEVLRGLAVKDIGKITVQMTKMRAISRETMEQVVREVTDAVGRGDIHLCGEHFVKTVLSKGLGEEGANRILELASQEGPIEVLRWVDTKTLVNFLVSEHPQTIAIIVCLLEQTQAAEVLSALPEALKSDVAKRIATIERIPEEAINDLREVIKKQLDLGGGKGKKLGGTKTLAEILNQCDRSTEQKVLGKIEEENSQLADSIRQLMFVFDDLVKVDDRGIQLILKEVSTEDLSLALKTASQALKDKIFKNMSQRAAQILKEDMQVRGPVKVSEVEAAQMNVVKVARRLEADGKIVIAGRGGEELVV